MTEEEQEVIEKLKDNFILTTSEQNKLANLIDRLQKENEELKSALLDTVNQFAYDIKANKLENEKLYTGGLSALENAFYALDIEEGIKRKDLWKMKKENNNE